MQPFEVLFPTRILFGVGELVRIGQEAKQLGKKALLVTGGTSAKATGLLERVCDLLEEAGHPFVLFDRVESNPRTATVDAGAKLALEAECDHIIALGGGSVMDASKAIALAAYAKRPIYDYMRGNPSAISKDLFPIEQALPLLTVPTVAATGSEANSISVLTHWESHEKSSVSGPGLYPQVAILDPSLTYTVPYRVTAESCADIFSHLFESYLISASGTNIQDGFTETLIRQVFAYSTVALDHPEHEEARSTLLWASTLAISAFTLSGRGAGYPLHGAEHPLSGFYDIPHGRGLAMLTVPYFRQVILKDRPERLARMGRACFQVSFADDQAAAQATIEAVGQWFARMGITERLSDYEIPREQLSMLAEEAVRIGGRGAGYLASSRPLSADDVLALYEACY